MATALIIRRAAATKRASLTTSPILFRFAPHIRGSRVLDFRPVRRPPGAISRAEALRHDALAAEAAGVLEHDIAVALAVFVEHDAGMRGANELGELALAVLDRPSPQILALQLDQVEGAKHGVVAMACPSDRLEHGEAVVVGDDRSASHKARHALY
jgi:hypothetical protein